jgi:cation diffusion facilitator CzcD-associated flavoprotein CzcO
MAIAPQIARFSGKTVLLVGSGSVAAALMLRLIGAGARVRWFAQDVDVAEEIWLSGHPDRIAIALREPRASDIENAGAVIVTAGESIAARVAAQARALNRPVAVIGRPDLSTFSLDDTDEGGPGDLAGWRPRPAAPLRRAKAWLSAHLSRAMGVLVELPASFGA